jgi:hypothetical protein
MRFKNISAPEISKEDMQKYKNQVDRTVRQFEGRHHFIDYHNAHGFIRAMEEFLYEDVSMMRDNECYLDAFELTKYLFTTVSSASIDDSSGGTGEFAECCCEIWTDILNESDIDTKKLLFKEFTDLLDGSVIDYMEEYIERILMDEFTEKEFLNAKLELIDEKVRGAEKIQDSWSREYRTGHWALRRIGVMESCGSSWNEIERYCTEHWAPSSVRRYYIDQCLKEKNYDRAIEVLKESMVLDSNFRGLITGYSTQLKELYKLRGENEKYLELLWLLMLEHQEGDLEVYRELKEQYPEAEWSEKREKIFAGLPGHADIGKLYREDMLYDRLLKHVLSRSGLYGLSEHGSVLAKEYPEEVLEKYRGEVEKMAMHTSDRTRYKELVSILRSMKKITGGSRIVSEIASHWRMAYANRPAMMDELSGL